MAGDGPTERSDLLGDDHENTDGATGDWIARALSASVGRVGERTVRVIAAISAVALVVTVATMVLVYEKLGSSSADMMSVYPLEFDIIIVGGGPAGAMVSKRLSDNPKRRVLLIEAGDASQAELGGTRRIAHPANSKNLTPFDVPFYWTNVANTPSLHWDYPDVSVAKALGGCGIHNAMLYVRALPSDLERWNMKGWTWEKALDFYMRMENFDGPNVSYHGKSGTVRTSPPSTIDELSRQFIQACEDIGIRRTEDFNAPHGRHGAGFYHFNTRDGVRESAARQFIGPMLKEQRENFHMMLNTVVLKVNINEAVTRATGVDVQRADGTVQTIRVAQGGQVIITAGAISTPKVLMLSGLGHGDDLNQLGIPVKKHLPRVGMNLQDHPVLAMSYQNPQAAAFDLEAEMASYFQQVGDKHANATSFGTLGSAGISAGAFLIPPGATLPEIQLTFFPQTSEPHVSNSSELTHAPQILITVALLHPSARNRIVLTTEDHNEYTPRVISEVPDQEAEHLRTDDVSKLVWGVNAVREITARLASKRMIGHEISPGPQIATIKALHQWVPDAVFRNSHWVGSASMGRSPTEGVVDERLRVFGVHNLRVADASVIPAIPNGNVHSSVLMVASHAAELIEQDG